MKKNATTSFLGSHGSDPPARPANPYRHEFKFGISPQDYQILVRRVSAVMKRDPYATADGGYTIYSLYFDSVDDKALNEKLAGAARREKFRMRLYNGDTGMIRLEKKSKIRNLGWKESAQVTPAQCQRLLDGDIDWMKDAGEPLLAELYGKMKIEGLRPGTISRYRREAYIYGPGNVRVTFDSELRTAIRARDFLSVQKLPWIATAPGRRLMEVKYDAFLPDVIRDILQLGDRRAGSFSKYVASRIYG